MKNWTHFDSIWIQSMLVISVQSGWRINEDYMGKEGHMGKALFGGSYGERVRDIGELEDYIGKGPIL